MEKKREECDVYGFHPGQDERVGFVLRDRTGLG